MHLLSVVSAPHLLVSIGWVAGGAALTFGLIFALWRWALAEQAAAGAHRDDARVGPPSDATP